MERWTDERLGGEKLMEGYINKAETKERDKT